MCFATRGSEGQTMLKIERYDDYPKIKKQAGNFLDRIYFAVKEYRKCYADGKVPNYCPNCGAKMKGGAE